MIRNPPTPTSTPNGRAAPTDAPTGPLQTRRTRLGAAGYWVRWTLGLVALVAFRVSYRDQETARALYRVTPAPPRPAPLRSEPRPAIEAPRQVHLHFHGVDPADVAELIRRHNEQE